jgi:hypothetical protein
VSDELQVPLPFSARGWKISRLLFGSA